MNIKKILIVLAFVMPMAVNAEEEGLSAEDNEYMEWSQNIWDSLDPKTGEIKLPGVVAILTLIWMTLLPIV